MTEAYVDRLTFKVNGKTVHSPGSNFYIEPDDTHVEGEFQAAKEINPIKRKLYAKRFVAMPPNKAKRAGGRNGIVDLRPDWERVKIGIMHDFVLRKFTEHDECCEWLFDTGILLIVEGNWWCDNFWGNCRCKRCSHITGKNHLGKILMDVRHELRGNAR